MGQEDISVDELCKKIKRGAIRLPEMQRKYVWRKTQVRDLLDSLYRGYPTGTILTWVTDEPVETQKIAIDAQKGGQQYQLLLDGQQRLVSLAAVLNGNPITLKDEEPKPIDILFNLEHPDKLDLVTEARDGSNAEDPDVDEAEEASPEDIASLLNKMTFIVARKDYSLRPEWISVTRVFNSTDREIIKAAGVTDLDDERYDKYTERLNRLRKIKDYMYRVNILDNSRSYNEVTEIFVRVNSLGAKLLSSDLALAQITAKWRGAGKIFEDFEQDCIHDKFDLGVSTHIRNLMTFATGRADFSAASRISSKELKTGWNDAKEGMQFSLELLHTFGIESSTLLSSPFIAIPIAYYGKMNNYDISAENQASLKRWALLANAKGRYSRGSSDTLLYRDLRTITTKNDVGSLLRLLEEQVVRLTIEESDLEGKFSRSALFKTMLISFVAGGAVDWKTGLKLKIPIKTRKNRYSIQFHHVFPRAQLREKHDRSVIDDISNLAIISGKTNRNIGKKKPAEYLQQILDAEHGEKALRDQCIPVDPALWRMSAFGDFLVERRKLLTNTINDFLA